jgi:hypothetical protein
MKDLEKFEKTLERLCKKYGIESYCFGGDTEDRFLGIHHPDFNNVERGAHIVCTEARLYQSGREKLLNYFEQVARGQLK